MERLPAFSTAATRSPLPRRGAPKDAAVIAQARATLHDVLGPLVQDHFLSDKSVTHFLDLLEENGVGLDEPRAVRALFSSMAKENRGGYLVSVPRAAMKRRSLGNKEPLKHEVLTGSNSARRATQASSPRHPDRFANEQGSRSQRQMFRRRLRRDLDKSAQLSPLMQAIFHNDCDKVVRLFTSFDESFANARATFEMPSISDHACRALEQAAATFAESNDSEFRSYAFVDQGIIRTQFAELATNPHLAIAGCNSLTFALHTGASPEIIAVLLKYDPDLLNLQDGRGETPLTTAALLGDSRALRFLLAQGANPNAPNARGRTPLMEAVTVGQKRAIKRLIAHGGDIFYRAPDRSSAVSLAFLHCSETGLVNERFAYLLDQALVHCPKTFASINADRANSRRSQHSDCCYAHVHFLYAVSCREGIRGLVDHISTYLEKLIDRAADHLNIFDTLLLTNALPKRHAKRHHLVAESLKHADALQRIATCDFSYFEEICTHLQLNIYSPEIPAPLQAQIEKFLSDVLYETSRSPSCTKVGQLYRLIGKVCEDIPNVLRCSPALVARAPAALKALSLEEGAIDEFISYIRIFTPFLNTSPEAAKSHLTQLWKLAFERFPLHDLNFLTKHSESISEALGDPKLRFEYPFWRFGVRIGSDSSHVMASALEEFITERCDAIASRPEPSRQDGPQVVHAERRPDYVHMFAQAANAMAFKSMLPTWSGSEDLLWQDILAAANRLSPEEVTDAARLLDPAVLDLVREGLAKDRDFA